jgi:hypothetical protein
MDTVTIQIYVERRLRDAWCAVLGSFAQREHRTTAMVGMIGLPQD